MKVKNKKMYFFKYKKYIFFVYLLRNKFINKLLKIFIFIQYWKCIYKKLKKKNHIK